MSDKSAENLRRIRAWDAEWDESKHSRADNGQFTSGGGGGGAKKAPEYGGYTPPKFHGTKEQIFKQATAQGKKNAARAAVLANATPVKAKFSKKEQDVLKGTDASEKDIQKLIGQIPHMSDPEAWSRVHDFCFSDEQADQVFKILKSKAAKAAAPAAPAKSKPAPTPKSTVEANIRRAEEIQESYGWRNGRNKDVDLGDKSGGKYKLGGFYYAKNPYAGRNVQSPGTLVGWTESGDAILYNRRHGRWTATVQNLDDHN